ncbi:hypothetical protein D3C87_1658150 [compost metagenome]
MHFEAFFSVVSVQISIVLVHGSDNVGFIGGEVDDLGVLGLELIVGNAREIACFKVIGSDESRWFDAKKGNALFCC